MDIRLTAGGEKSFRVYVCEEHVTKQIQLVRKGYLSLSLHFLEF
jgi:hypothetical protein